MTSDLRSRILERAGGNPFFLEEIVQRLMDEPAGIEWLEIPDTVQGVLAARIDLLTPLEKRALQSASVIGRTFWNGAVRSLLDPDPGLARARRGATASRGSRSGPRADRLDDRRRTRVLVPPHPHEGCRVRRPPRRDRARAHARVAEWIELQTREREREFAELLTHHYERAHRPDPCGLDPIRPSRAAAAARVSVLVAGRQGSGEQAGTAAGGAIRRDRPVPRHGDTRARPCPRDTRHDVLPPYEGDRAWRCFKEAIDLLIERPEESGAPPR